MVYEPAMNIEKNIEYTKYKSQNYVKECPFPFFTNTYSKAFMNLVPRKSFEIAEHGKPNSVVRIQTSKFY